MSPTFSKIQFGDGLAVTDEGAGVIRVDGTGGVPGPPGPAGPQGVSGASSFLSGTGPPTAAVGADGSVYLDLTSSTFYGPKTAGAWPAAPLGHLVKAPGTYANVTARYPTYTDVKGQFASYTELRGF